MKKFAFSIIAASILVSGLSVYQKNKFEDGKLHVIFCDVGQGDGILIKTPSNKYVLVDGGPDKRILECLASNMPFWQRKIDLMILTHPHLDHFYGMNYLIDRYEVTSFATEDLSNNAESFQGLIKSIEKKKIPQKFVLVGDKWTFGDGTVIEIEAPTEEFINRTSPGGTIGEKSEFASLIVRVSYGEFDAILTGDSQAGGVSEAILSIEQDVEVLQVPHHGSASGLTDQILKDIKPELAVISVGFKNRYNHPRKQILDLLQNNAIKTLRTDQEGDIVVVSNGKEWGIVQ